MILTGLFAIGMLAKRIGHFQKWIITVGQNTLVIYLFHSFVVTILVKVLRIVHTPINAFTNALITILTCAVCTVLALIINQYVPVLLGRKRVKQR
jgi:fucose 4-O-acetylase-like acetyltransferase